MAPHSIGHFLKRTHETFKQWKDRVSALKKNRQKEDEPPAQIAHPQKHEKLEIAISGATMAKFIAIGIILYLLTLFLYEIRDILVIFFVALLFAAALDPMVDSLERRKIPRSIGVILIYIVILAALGLLISNLIPIVAKELGELAVRIQDYITNIVNGKIELPKYLEGLRPTIKQFFEGVDISKLSDYKDILLNAASRLSNVAGNVFNAVLVIFNGFFNTILVFVITFLMTVDEAGIDKFILALFPARYADYIRAKSNAVKEKMGYWLRGQIVLCVVVGILVYIGFFIVGLFTKPVEYAASISLLAGFTELIPYAGPFIAWFIALPIVANQSVMLIVWMTVVMYAVQLLENNVIVPMVMHRAVGISPILVIFAMFVGFSFLGILGMVLSVPVATMIAIFVKDYAEREK
ncbi:AI-2E family transporter [Candidatus Peregrinibacteria bacterium]|nr:AI-2E family transporter [Candidatus Peregrinibacteria bacterium]